MDWLQKIKEEKIQKTYTPARGGTELLLDGLHKNTKIKDYENINLMISTPHLNNIRYAKQNLLWEHHNHMDNSLGPLQDPVFVKSVDSFVYVSNWQYEKYRYFHNVPTHNAYVIKNAIQPIEFKPKSKDGKVKLIYASTPFRGLDVLLESFKRLNRDDVELDVYSSTIIYGTDFYNNANDNFKHLFEQAESMKNVNYKGYGTNEEIRKAMQEAHILAYPSIFEETSCLVMIEAGAAGCDMVTTSLGALYETGSEYAKMIPMGSTKEDLVSRYTKALNEAIDNYWNVSNQEMLKEQSDFYNKFYSWEKRAKEWNELFEKLSLD
jgi:glycosyltransferase involved in cell wall biosynthesis